MAAASGGSGSAARVHGLGAPNCGVALTSRTTVRIIVINLDHDTGRRARIERRLAELDLRWERLSAVDGRRLGPHHECLIDRAAHAARGLEFSPGAIGCWLSHREAQRMVAEGAEPMALILEDDIAIADELPEVLERIERGEAGRFDVIRLHRYKMHRKFVAAHRIGDGALGFVRPTDSGTQAYVITREAARRLVAAIPRMVQLADHALYEHWTHGLVVCSIDPPVVLHDDQGRSSIGARLLPGKASLRPVQWLRRKRHQIHKKIVRRRSWRRMLRRYAKTGRLSEM